MKQQIVQPRGEVVDAIDVRARREAGERSGADRARAPIEDRGQRGRNDRALAEQAAQARPGRRIENGDHLERLRDAPRRSRGALARELAAQAIQIAVHVVVDRAQAGERCDQGIGDEEADRVVQQAPAGFEFGNQVVLDEERVRQPATIETERNARSSGIS